MKVVALVFALVVVLLSVSFYTLFERKVLGSGHIRQGPVYVSQSGLLQPFSDAIKLLGKPFSYGSESVSIGLGLVPLALLSSSLMFMVFFPWGGEVISESYYLVLFFCLSSMGGYSLIFLGFVSNSKYASVGSMRGLAQALSYEVCLIFAFLLVSFPLNSFLWKGAFDCQSTWSWLCALSPIAFMFVCLLMAETNRAPFDFAEGESELVSGFNVEYSSWGFVFIFLSEYFMVVVMSLLMVFLFMNSLVMSFGGLIFLSLMLGLFLVIRGVLPRYRYDKLMALFWQVILPSLLSLLVLVVLF